MHVCVPLLSQYLTTLAHCSCLYLAFKVHVCACDHAYEIPAGWASSCHHIHGDPTFGSCKTKLTSDLPMSCIFIHIIND